MSLTEILPSTVELPRCLKLLNEGELIRREVRHWPARECYEAEGVIVLHWGKVPGDDSTPYPMVSVCISKRRVRCTDGTGKVKVAKYYVESIPSGEIRLIPKPLSVMRADWD